MAVLDRIKGGLAILEPDEKTVPEPKAAEARNDGEFVNLVDFATAVKQSLIEATRNGYLSSSHNGETQTSGAPQSGEAKTTPSQLRFQEIILWKIFTNARISPESDVIYVHRTDSIPYPQRLNIITRIEYEKNIENALRNKTTKSLEELEVMQYVPLSDFSKPYAEKLLSQIFARDIWRIGGGNQNLMLHAPIRQALSA